MSLDEDPAEAATSLEEVGVEVAEGSGGGGDLQQRRSLEGSRPESLALSRMSSFRMSETLNDLVSNTDAAELFPGALSAALSAQKRAEFDELVTAAADEAERRQLPQQVQLQQFQENTKKQGILGSFINRVKATKGSHPSLGRLAERRRITRDDLQLAEQRQELVGRLLAYRSADGDSFQEKLAKELRAVDVQLPSITVQYNNFSIEAKAKEGSKIDTVANTITDGVSLKSGPQPRKKLLQNVTGILKPGRSTLLLGPAGGGKSVFMKALSGRLKNVQDLEMTGDLFYNGHRQDEFVITNSASYVEQLDNHFPTLTVRETLEFAKQCQRGPGEASVVKTVKLLLEQRRKKAKSQALSSEPSATDLSFESLLNELNSSGPVVVDYVLKLMGIDGCQDTVVGDAMLRGVSGGQKKRVTTAEMLVGFTTLLLMDEISTGLDSATTFQVALFITNYTHAMNCTSVVGLLQPPPETVALFDDIMIIGDGRIVYHGPTSDTLPFFEAMGFNCPPRKDLGTFLQELFTPLGQLEYASGTLKRSRPSTKDGPDDGMLMPVEKMSEFFWNSNIGKSLRAEAKDTMDRSLSHPDALRKQKYALSTFQSFRVLFKRQVLLLKRNTNLIYSRAGFAVLTGIILGTVFFQLKPEPQDWRSYFGLFYLTCMYLALGNLPQVAITFNAKSIFYKHKTNNFFPSWVYVLVQLAVHIPFALVETFVFGVCMYFLAGLSIDQGHLFFVWWLVAFSTHVSMAAMFRFVANISPSLVRASSIASVVLLVNILTSGYTIVADDIPPWWIWLYWISPFAYAIRAFVINEMTSPGWGDMGDLSLESFDFKTTPEWIWIGVGFQWGFTLVMVILSSLVLSFADTRSRLQVRISDQQRDQAIAQAKQEIRRAKLRLKELNRKSGAPTSPQAVNKSSASVVLSIDEAEAELPFASVSLVWRDLKYIVKTPAGAKLELLKGISGFARPNRLTALMGGSGAGKTTLMDVISGRKTQGDIKGDLLVNGKPKNQAAFARIMGYVEQTDIHSPEATVREALHFSAALRLSADATAIQRDKLVQDTIRMVEMDSLQESLVGVPGISGLSGEQRKRLTIAVELVANPSVVFLDEPTSGLDATAASTVVRAMRSISEAGRTVMATIHQPSIEIFSAFDALVLLKRGGRLIFFGPLGEGCGSLISYLEAQPSVAPILDGYNPATWMLEVSGGEVLDGEQVLDFADLYERSDLKQANETDLQEELEASKSQPDITLDASSDVPLVTQFNWLLKKAFKSYWRSPSYNITRMIVIALMAIMYGSIYWQQGALITASEIPENRVQNLLGVIFSSITFVAVFQLTAVQPIVAYERSVFTREQAARMYSVWPKSMAQIIVELPFLIVQSIIFVPILYFMVGFVADVRKFFFYWLVNFVSLSLFTFFGEWLVYVTPNQQLAQVFGAGLNQVWNIMCGFLVAFPLIPIWWQWANRLTPSTWLIYSLAASQMGDSTATVTGTGTELGSYLATNFGYQSNFGWASLGIAFCFVVFFRVTSTLALRYINFSNR